MSELKEYYYYEDRVVTPATHLYRVYHADAADKVIAEKDKEIAELKDKCQMHDFFWEGCGFAKRGFKNSIAVREAFDRLEAENERLMGESCKLTDGCLRLKQCRKEKAHLADELRHSKRKRCLNKAEWCEERCARYDLLQEHSGFSWRREIDFYSRWYQRWLELAEKFKEDDK